MKKLLSGIVLFVFASLLFNSCVSADTFSPTAIPVRQTATPVVVKPSWQTDWEKTMVAAKQEGKVSVISRWAGFVREPLAKAFQEKYGLEIQYTIGTATEIWPKVEAERRSGLYLRDIASEGITALQTTYVTGGAIEPMEPTFILPEVKDNNAWRDKKLPFNDKEGQIFMFLYRVGPTLLTNKEMVKAEELGSWRNLLEPKWKGKILVADPSIPGPGNSIIATVGELIGLDYLKELAKQDPVISRDMRGQVEWVARGKYPIGVGFEFTLMEEMRAAGAPLVHVVPAEGSYAGSAVGSISMFNRPAHPNAAKVFINWFLSNEGQGLFARAAKEQSRRVDIVPELAPDRLIQEGMKYIDFDSDTFIKKRYEMYSLSKEIFAAHYK